MGERVYSLLCEEKMAKMGGKGVWGGGMGEGKRETMYLSLHCHYQYQ